MMNDWRKKELEIWLEGKLETTEFSCEPASSDASFRRYFRVTTGDISYIAMDAPPSKENSEPFVKIARFLRALSVQAPEVFFYDFEQGFLLLSDLGSKDYLDYLDEGSVNLLYQDAMAALHKIQQANTSQLESYDEQLLLNEMLLFDDWFVSQLLKVELSLSDSSQLLQVQKALISSALEQPQVFVHRDFHSRNLMLTTEGNPGVIDFQDAVRGPMSYDLVSLLRDCYISWPEGQVYKWLNQFLETRQEAGANDDFTQEQFRKWFDFMGVQRHLKAVGIFSRLNIRDNKPGYMKDIPRTLAYVLSVAERYEELMPLATIIKERQLVQKLAAHLNEQALLG